MAVDRIPQNPTKFDARAKAVFLAAYAATGRVAQSARAANISVSYINAMRRLDDAFAAEILDAYQIFCDSLEEEAYRRAAVGLQKTIYYKGQPVLEYEIDDRGELVMIADPDNPGQKIPKVKGVATEREFSDTLMLALLKKFIPAYRDKQTVDLNVTGLEGLLADIKNKSTGLPAEQMLPSLPAPPSKE